jgi:tRNA A-37 threonylcarbamoyl transferase component Bud32
MNAFGSIQVREGDVLAGKYRIERLLGVGGMGVVVAARHVELDQLVAIKFVRDDALDNEEAVERFLREARSAARLKSEHVARVLDVGKLASGAPYMVMEFLEGSDLAQTLTRDGPMAVDLAAALMMQVCEAVAEAHAAGIVHRDLKPENLFLTRTIGGSPKMKVLDFGVSKSARLADDPRVKLTRTRTVLGSPLYMPPEQMRSSRDVDARGDVWALGVVLFELLTGRSPFEAETMPELCLKIVSEPPLSLAQLRPELPPRLVEIVERCLEKDKTKRYDSASELAEALASFAPPRSVVFTGRPSVVAAEAIAPRSVVAPADPVPASDGPPRVASIPAAWGTEGRHEPQPAPARRATAATWAVVALLAGGASIVAFAVGRPGGTRAPAASASPAVQPPPAVTEIAPEHAELPRIADTPFAPATAPSSSSGSRAVASDLPALVEATVAPAAASNRPADPSGAAKTTGAAAPASPAHRVVRSSSVPSAVARPDDDIPSLR